MNNATQIKQPTIQQVQWTQFWEKKSMDKQAENEKKEMISQTWEISVKQKGETKRAILAELSDEIETLRIDLHPRAHATIQPPKPANRLRGERLK